MEHPFLITFLKAEWNDVQARLSEQKLVYTIRVSEEYGKYQEGDLFQTEWGTQVKIVSVRKIRGGINALKMHYPFYHQLTDEMIRELQDYDEMEMISLKAI